MSVFDHFVWLALQGLKTQQRVKNHSLPLQYIFQSSANKLQLIRLSLKLKSQLTTIHLATIKDSIVSIINHPPTIKLVYQNNACNKNLRCAWIYPYWSNTIALFMLIQTLNDSKSLSESLSIATAKTNVVNFIHIISELFTYRNSSILIWFIDDAILNKIYRAKLRRIIGKY